MKPTISLSNTFRTCSLPSLAPARSRLFYSEHISVITRFSSAAFFTSLRGGPDIEFYEQVGRTNYQVVASHAVARRCELDDVFEGLADRFRDVRLALNQLSDQLLNLDDDARPSLSL